MIALLFLLATMSCSKGTRVFSFKQSGITPASAMKIETIKPVAAKPGEVVTITGQALTRQSQVKIGDTIVEFTESNVTMAKFIMPETPRAGAFKITVGRYNDPTGTVEGPAKYMLSDNAGDDYPIYMAKAAEICSPIGFRDANGDLQVGSKDCAAVTVNDCAADGEVGCKTTASFKATDMTLATVENIKAGASVAGVAGTYTGGSQSGCTADGAIDCVTTAAYPAALASGAASKILLGQSHGGVAGNIALPAPGKVYTGISYGVNANSMAGTLTIPAAANVLSTAPAYGDPGAQLTPSLASQGSWAVTSAFPGAGYYAGVIATPAASSYTGTLFGTAGTATLAPANCAADGATGCVAVATYPAALASGAASKILSGQTLAGTAGNITLPAVGKVYTGITYGVSSTGSTGTLTYPAAGNVLSTAPAYGDPGSQLTPSLSTCAADGSGCYLPAYSVSTQPLKAISYDAINTNKTAIRTSLTLSGIAGTLADCSTNAVTGCVTTATYKSADLTNLTAANIKNTVVIAGVTGQYPSATYPLTGSSGADLTNATFNAQIKSSATFQYFGSDGTRNTGTGDINLTATNIANGVSIFGTTGTSTGGAAPDPGDLRAGVTVGSVTGKLKYNCRNTVNSSLYNYDGAVGSIGTSGVTSGTALDIWDTIDDYNNNLAGLPPSLVTGWSTDTQCGGVEVTAGDTNVWRDVTTTNGTIASTCAGTPAGCSYKDKISSLEWSAQAAATKTWPAALSYCDALTYNFKSDWRLPTQKELMSGYEHGILSVPATNFLTATNNFWSSSTNSLNANFAWDVYVANGQTTTNGLKNSSYTVVCVRP